MVLDDSCKVSTKSENVKNLEKNIKGLALMFFSRFSLTFSDQTKTLHESSRTKKSIPIRLEKIPRGLSNYKIDVLTLPILRAPNLFSAYRTIIGRFLLQVPPYINYSTILACTNLCHELLKIFLSI